MTYDKPQTLPNIGFFRVGYAFLGWSEDKNATEKTYDN
jgi:hypothetical protein